MKTMIATSLLASAVCFTLPAFANHEHMQKKLEKADTNNDGLVSEEEFLASKKDYFKEADKDGNGSLDKNEQEALKDKMHDKIEHYKKHKHN